MVVGTGIPSVSNTHEVAQAVAPECRVVYVDNDQMVLAHARALLRSHEAGVTAYLDADLRDTVAILDGAARILDFSKPVAVMLIAVLQYIGPEEDPHGIVSQLMAAVPPGSHLVVSHPASDIAADQVGESMRRYNDRAAEQATPRTHAEVSRFFDDLNVLDPGIVPIPQWRPDAQDASTASVAMWGGVGAKQH